MPPTSSDGERPRRALMPNLCWIVLLIAAVAGGAMFVSHEILTGAFTLLASPDVDMRVEGMTKLLQTGGVVAFAGTVVTALAMIAMRVIERD